MCEKPFQKFPAIEKNSLVKGQFLGRNVKNKNVALFCNKQHQIFLK